MLRVVSISIVIGAALLAVFGASGLMAPFLYNCPNTRQTVQGFTADEVPSDAYESVTCLACQRLHFVNPSTGKVLGGDDDA
jgi:hypothetical protein